MDTPKNAQPKGVYTRYLSIMAARTIGFVLVMAFIVAVVGGAVPFVKAFLGKGEIPVTPNSSSQYKGGENTKDPVQEALVKIQSDYASGNPDTYIVKGSDANLSASIAAGNILKLTQEKGITSFTQLKDYNNSANGVEVANAIGSKVWVKNEAESKVSVISMTNAVQCSLDLATHQAVGCTVP